MSDVFQALLPQGGTLGAITPAAQGTNKAMLNGSSLEGLVSEGQPQSISFKIAFQNSVIGKKPIATQTLPEAFPVQALLPKDTLIMDEEMLSGGESLPLLPAGMDEILPLMVEELSHEQEGATFLFSAPEPNQPVLLPGEVPPKEDKASASAGLPNFAVSYRTGSFTSTESMNAGVTLEGGFADAGENNDFSAMTFPLSKLVSTAKRESGGQSLASSGGQLGPGRIGGSMSQDLMGISSAMNSERLMAGNQFSETLASQDLNLQTKSVEGASASALTRSHGDFGSAPSIALQSVDSSVSAEGLKMSIRFGQPGWAEQLVERAANLAGQNIKQAEVQLNPQELGSINIKISVSQEQAAVTFAAQNAQVREAIDQTLHRLRDAFESSGLELVQADVHDQRSGSQGAEGDEQSTSANNLSDVEASDETLTEVTVSASGIDHFV